MFSSPRPIFFSTELETPPIKELAIPREAALRLFFKLREKPSGCRYENIETQATNPTLSTRRGEDGRSTCQIGRHMVRIEELHPEMPADEFVNVAKTVLQTLGDDCKPFFVQRCKIQCLAQPNVLPSPLGILATRVGNVGPGERIAPFGRPPTFFGVRFRFDPWSPDEEPDSDATENETTDHDVSEIAEDDPPGAGEAEDADDEDAIQQVTEGRGFLTVRFEPYTEDPRQMWVEVAANYIAPEPIIITDLSIMERNILETCRFATDNCKRFLDQFDPQADSPGGQP